MLLTMGLLTVQLLSTLAMFGLIWFVQMVHYPLFLQVGPQQFPAYEQAHANRTTWVVAPLMLVELGSSLALLVPRWRAVGVSAAAAWMGAALVALIWLSTALVQVPLHNRLHAGYSTTAIRQLVATNWVRTAAWTARSILVLSWIFRAKSA